jgi:hypothetical protein
LAVSEAIAPAIAREILLGSVEDVIFTKVKGVFSFDADLVQMRFYTADRAMIGHIGLSPKEARRVGALFIAAANKIDPKGALAVAKVPA